MERLKRISNRKVKNVQNKFKRYLYDQIDWSQRLIIILGQRGTGKTTLLLQKMKKMDGGSIYLSLDDFYFEANRFVMLVDQLYEQGYRYLFLDEVHRYQYWSIDIKNVYDSFPDLNLVVTGSSILDLNQGQADLSRRAVVYHLSGMSLREFIYLEYEIETEVLLLDDIINDHQDIATHFSDLFDPINIYEEYLMLGYYPFFTEGKEVFGQKLLEIVDQVLEVDISPSGQLNYSTTRNMKKLLYIISQSVPFTPNISKLSEKIGISRNTLLQLLDLLSQAGLLSLLRQNTVGVSYLQKPEKIYLQNPSLAYWLSEGQPNKGNLRETFFISQLGTRYQVKYPRYGDFMIDDKYTIEVGGPSKSLTQITGVPQAYVAADGIKAGSGQKIPLWLFGFLY